MVSKHVISDALYLIYVLYVFHQSNETKDFYSLWGTYLICHYFLALVMPVKLTTQNRIGLCLVTQVCPTLCEPRDCARQAPLSMGILQAKILEWVVMPSSRGSSQPSDQTQVSHIAGGFFTV